MSSQSIIERKKQTDRYHRHRRKTDRRVALRVRLSLPKRKETIRYLAMKAVDVLRRGRRMFLICWSPPTVYLNSIVLSNSRWNSVLNPKIGHLRCLRTTGTESCSALSFWSPVTWPLLSSGLFSGKILALLLSSRTFLIKCLNMIKADRWRKHS